jgi:cytoskeletal protein CcmA (bactofilin family)
MAIFNKDGRTADSRTSTAEATLSVIAPGLRVKGDLFGPGLLKIDGRVEGSIHGPRQVIIGRDGSVRGNVEASEVVLAGTIEGSILGAERVEVQGTAVMHGDIHTRVIVVHEGAQVNGVVQMGAQAASDSEGRPAVQVVR